MEATAKKARLSNDPLFKIQKCFEQDTLASVQYQNGYKPIANKGLFLSYNNMVVGKSFYQFPTIIESALIRLCPKNKYPTKIDFIELKLFKKQPWWLKGNLLLSTKFYLT